MEQHGAKVGTFHDYLRGVPSLTRISPKGGFKASGKFRPGAAISAVIIGNQKIRVYAVLEGVGRCRCTAGPSPNVGLCNN
jgi:hypothetical protein